MVFINTNCVCQSGGFEFGGTGAGLLSLHPYPLSYPMAVNGKSFFSVPPPSLARSCHSCSGKVGSLGEQDTH